VRERAGAKRREAGQERRPGDGRGGHRPRLIGHGRAGVSAAWPTPGRSRCAGGLSRAGTGSSACSGTTRWSGHRPGA
jgi:hypothetical protein